MFLEASLGWSFWEIGAFLGLWVIGYGIVQGSAPGLRRLWGRTTSPGVSAVQFWSALLTAIPALIAVALWRFASALRRRDDERLVSVQSKAEERPGALVVAGDNAA